MPSLPMITHPLLALPGIRHGFFTREGGVSSGIYASLNCGVGSKDERALVLANRARAMTALGVDADKLATPYQVHGTETIVVDEAWEAGKGPRADAVVTQPPRPCRRRRRGRLRAGALRRRRGARRRRRPCRLARARLPASSNRRSTPWRGSAPSAGGSSPCLVRRSRRRTTRSGRNSSTAFETADPASRRFFIAASRPGHSMFDLTGYIVARLARRRRDRGGARPLHLRRSASASIPIGGRPISASRTMAGCSRRSRLRTDRHGASFRTRRIRRAAREDAAARWRSAASMPCCSSRRRACTG